MEVIGHIHTPFPDKFSVPRQPGLAPSVTATITLCGDYDHQASIAGIQAHSHLWLMFQFHQNAAAGWKAKVRPPRLGGNKSIGVFASRSPFRPNQLGLSVVQLLDVIERPQVQFVVAGADLVDGTPLVDIKPYVPYVDCVPEAVSEWAGEAPQPLNVVFSPLAQQQLLNYLPQQPKLQQVIIEVLQQDPRPAYHRLKDQDKSYGSRLYDYDLQWRVAGTSLIVEEIRHC